MMYGTKGIQLVKEIANGEKGQLTPFSSDVFSEVIAECSQHFADLRSLIRYNRAEILRNLVWKVGSEIPEEIQEKLSHSEKEYFKKHSEALKSYMSRVVLELAVDMVPPKDPYIKVRVLDDMGEVELPSDNTANFARHSMHFLKRTDAEKYISLGKMEELTG
ncbi:putative DNA replication complex GINS protein PSF1 [Prunus yedoensis var. nudiflora]|uniref:Putative DNA replication complex GINS protein PSF1 n=1 Tax=Prunus yedoensis var. nudiflora TaxID=2094558 RepID=A0A314XQ37_PRUYE|nr:putative DNA replication complex GINS protein PSF1 [Prunus yedoensis var. nudiflora]